MRGKTCGFVKEEDGERYDIFLCMDDSNLRRAKGILGEVNGYKCQKLLSLVGEKGDVADPWYTGNFEITYKDIERAVKKLL